MEAGFWFLLEPKISYSRPCATRPTSGVHGEARGAATRGQAAAYRAHGSPRAVPCPSACSSGQQVGHAHRNRPWGCLGARWPRLGQPSVAVPYDPTHTQGRVLVASSSPGEPTGPLGWLLRLQGPGNRPHWRPKRLCHFRLPQAEQPTHQIGALVASELVEAIGHFNLLAFEDLAAVRDTEVPAAVRRHFRLPQAELFICCRELHFLRPGQKLLSFWVWLVVRSRDRATPPTCEGSRETANNG